MCVARPRRVVQATFEAVQVTRREPLATGKRRGHRGNVGPSSHIHHGNIGGSDRLMIIVELQVHDDYPPMAGCGPVRNRAIDRSGPSDAALHARHRYRMAAPSRVVGHGRRTSEITVIGR